MNYTSLQTAKGRDKIVIESMQPQDQLLDVDQGCLVQSWLYTWSM